MPESVVGELHQDLKVYPALVGIVEDSMTSVSLLVPEVALGILDTLESPLLSL